MRRDIDLILLEAKLALCPPEMAAESLEKRSLELTKPGSPNLIWDEEHEQFLLKFEHPLVDLVLAKNCIWVETASILFARNRNILPVKLALFSNLSVGGRLACPGYGTSFSLFERDSDCLDYLASAQSSEIVAICKNPKVSENFLNSLFDGGKVWNALTSANQKWAIYALSKNPRLQVGHNNGNPLDFGSHIMSGMDEAKYYSVFSSSLKMTESLPVEHVWASLLVALIEKLPLEEIYTFPNNPLQIADRWKNPDERDESVVKVFGRMDDFQEIRRILARYSVIKTRCPLDVVLNNVDIAIRCGAYSAGNLTEEQMEIAYHRDRQLAAYNLVFNPNLWKTSKLRNKLWEIIFDALKSSDDHFRNHMDTYRAIKERFMASNADWFADERNLNDENLGSDQSQVITKQDTEELVQKLNALAYIVGQLQSQLSYASRTSLAAFWILVLLVVVNILRLFV